MNRLKFLLLLLLLAAHAQAQNPALPVIPANTFYATNYGAVGDGVSTNTTAIQSAINAASSAGGGTVKITPGAFLCGPITLASRINLQLDAGAILRMLPFGQYPVTWFTNGSNYYFTANNFISGTSLTDIEISGSGAIDGQGQPWWPWANTNSAVRPIMIRLSGCNREWINNVTLSNSPMFHISVSGKAGNTLVEGVTIRAPSSHAAVPSHNTDACDMSGTNFIVRNCDISVGDDNFTCGGGTANGLVTNNVYGDGHGISIGSYTDGGGVSNLTFINCTMNGTDQGIRIKSNNDRGGLVRNIGYYNISMTNVRYAAIMIYEYYNTYTPYTATPATAAGTNATAVLSTTPIFRDITISNISATVQSGGVAGILWGRTEMRMTNVTLSQINISAPGTFNVFNTYNAQFLNSHLTNTASGGKAITIWGAGLTASNTLSGASTGVLTVDGGTNTGTNSLTFYNSTASTTFSNALAANPITLSAATLTISNNLVLSNSNVLNFTLGTSNASIVVRTNLTLAGTINVSAGAGFNNASYTLFTYGSGLTWETPTLGNKPSGYNYSFDTNTAGQVKLLVQMPPPAAPTNLTAATSNSIVRLSWSPSPTATSYNVKRATTNGGPYAIITSGVTATNFDDVGVTNGVTYFYVVSATNAGGESANSAQVSATPAPSLTPVSVTLQADAGQLNFSWPSDHTGWRLWIQTNTDEVGIGTNWTPVPGSQWTNQFFLTVDPAIGGVFLRLTYP